MEKKTLSRLEARTRIIKAIAHPTRLFIVEKLTDRDHCVCELTKMVGSDVSTVSKHLSVLKNAGVVETRRHGNNIYYHLRTRCILKFMDCIESVIESSLREQASVIGKRVR